MHDFPQAPSTFTVATPRHSAIARHVDFAAQIAIGYLVVSIVWILVSDRLVTWLFPEGDFASWAQSAKGIVFVSISALVLYLVVHLYVRRLASARTQLEAAWDQTLLGWALAIEARERETGQHSQRVAQQTVLLAQEMNVSADALPAIYRGALLHDIGKIGVPDSVLLFTGELDEQQWALMRQHPEIALRMLTPIEFLHDAMDIPLAHHERWDGSGYPQGLSGTDIPLPARIFAVVDVFDAVTSLRPYRSPMGTEDALALIWEGSGTHFDPAVVQAFDALLKRPETLLL